jgi:hypothetical protein
MKRLRSKGLWLLVPALVAGGVGSAFAYHLYWSYWEDAHTSFFSGIPGQSPSGQAWADVFRGAMNRWSDATPFRFDVDPGYRDPCVGRVGVSEGAGDFENGAAFRGDLCGSPFDNGTLAVTLTRGRVNPLGQSFMVEADIVFNSAYTWDVYNGPVRREVDFRRVALHELGHALGLDHELTNNAIMQPRVGLLNDLTADDIAGVNALYTPGGGLTCRIGALASNARTSGALSGADDCQLRDLFGGTDASLVDVYQVDVAAEANLFMHVKATGFDPVLVATTFDDREIIGVFDDPESCEATGATVPLPPGSYFVLVNTYDQPTDCGAGQGQYELSISDSPLPVLGAARTFGPASVPEGILFQAGASAGGGYGSFFAASDSIDVNARIRVAPEHAGQAGAIYMVAVLDDGRSFMKDSTGNFVRFSGQQRDLQPVQQQPLGGAPMEFEVVRGLRGDFTGLSGHDFYVFIGYSVASEPGRVYYPNAPLSFRIAPP